MHKRAPDRAQALTDTVQTLAAWCQEAERQFGAGNWGASVAAQGCVASGMARCETNTECCFCYSPFLVKAKVFFGFLWVSETILT